MATLTIWSESGGVGKTTTALNLAAALGRDEYEVLVVDFDPQPASLTDHAGYTKRKKADREATIVDALLDEEISVTDVRIEDELFDLVPAHESLASLESTVRAEQISMAEFLLRSALEPVESEYDFILIDPPATLNLLVDNALIASGNVLIPVEMTRKGERSAEGVIETVEALERQLQRAQPEFTLNVVGVLPNKVSGSTLNREVRTSLQESDIELLPVTVPDYNVLEQAWNAQLDIFRFADHDEHGLRPYQEQLPEVYRALADSVIERMETESATRQVSVE
ncbi:ATPase involved in chromosome partitioning-like protein [Natronococcus amylolyticus DSM 10524]|uniref:ATPase involved in chromosome partitioning-like protein n=1 Tax=Natronococcus amylolyticus DSM 10524 TaxID=1227497 RepID=L9X0E4_9EURY|nr:AAA family ATPase [Natronococcus amylolyticus]ELY55190.1 ATPase involved in chromosome partitioning-like protein [Natronococcus amylolyticus DSM 10524]